jgi:hypothetical protein
MKVEGPDGEIKDSCGNENTLNVLGCTKARPVQKVQTAAVKKWQTILPLFSLMR